MGCRRDGARGEGKRSGRSLKPRNVAGAAGHQDGVRGEARGEAAGGASSAHLARIQGCRCGAGTAGSSTWRPACGTLGTASQPLGCPPRLPPCLASSRRSAVGVHAAGGGRRAAAGGQRRRSPPASPRCMCAAAPLLPAATLGRWLAAAVRVLLPPCLASPWCFELGSWECCVIGCTRTEEGGKAKQQQAASRNYPVVRPVRAGARAEWRRHAG